MIYNLLDARIIISDFHIETNAVCLGISDINNENNKIYKKNKYLLESPFKKGTYFFSWITYINEHDTAKCIIDYPLGITCEFEVSLGRIDKLVNQICEKYREIYKEPDKWKIYGHEIYDLQLAGILLDTTTNTIKLIVDS